MKYLIPLLFLAMLAACDEPIPEPEPELIEYQVRFEVECDSCQAFYGVNGEGNLGDWISGIYVKDSVAYSGGNCVAAGIVLETEGKNDSIDVRIYVNDILVSSGFDYGTDSVDVLDAQCVYYFE